MKRTCTEADYIWALRPRRLKLPFRYDLGFVTGDVSFWADTVGVTSAQLKRATESLIRTCHHAALLQSKAIGNHPEVYGLGLGSLRVYYTVESEAVVVRGYSANWPDFQCTEEMSGGFSWDKANAPATPAIMASVRRVPISTRIRAELATALKRASLERQLNGVEPNSLQYILEQVIERWLKDNGYLK